MKNVKKKILVVDDESDIVEIVSYNLVKAGYQVVSAENGEKAIQIAEEIQPNLIILDVMMPVMGGLEACKILRTKPAFKNTFIVFLTARDEEYAEVAGFDVGADDYIAKPIKPRVLLSRINAIMRRREPDKSDNNLLKIKVKDLTIDRNSFLVFRNEEKINLAKKEFELLYLLASKPNQVLSRNQIFQNIWGDSEKVTSRTIDVHIRKLREKIGNHYVITVKGVGYKVDLS